MIRRPPRSPLFPYTPLSRSQDSSLYEVASALLKEGGRLSLFRSSTDASSSDSLNTVELAVAPEEATSHFFTPDTTQPLDRKSTRLNSSHLVISYAVFCLKKK